MTRVAIIGAGLSGLSLANLLGNKVDVTLFEKARGVSGRMSTRRAEPYFFDHGAQYFTARTKPFQNFIQPFINDGFIKRWSARYARFDDDKIIERKDWENDEPRYVGMPGMNSFAKALSKQLNIKLNTRVTSLEKDNKWVLKDAEGCIHEGFDWVISTAPSPQTSALLPKSFPYLKDIEGIEMRACFSLMLGFSRGLNLDFDAAHVMNADISWLAVNSNKPGRSNTASLIVHSSEDFAEKNLEKDPLEIQQYLCDETSRIISTDVSSAQFKAVHRWRYANNVERKTFPVFLDNDANLAACGDWCLGGRVENAFVSANNLYEKMKSSLDID
ncbi:MAG: NAD(P)/FAD-dependent oxidoreductase [Candidatus Azotimanducaceae bacterium]